MDKTTLKLVSCASIGAALLACAALPPGAEQWTPVAPGSSWQLSQKNTGSYGKDSESTTVRGEGVWQGTKVVTMTNQASGFTIHALPNGKWLAITDKAGKTIGEVTSGGFGPSLNGPMAMGYVARPSAEDGTALELLVRGKALPARVAKMPFTPHRYHRN